MTQTRRTISLPEPLKNDIDTIFALTGENFSELVRRLLRVEVERQRRTKLQLEGKEDKSSGPVGRPRQSADEKRFKDRVQFIDSMYSKRRDQLGAMFNQLMGEQFEIYRQAVEAHDDELVGWFHQNVPWQHPHTFEEKWALRDEEHATNATFSEDTPISTTRQQ